MEARGRTSGDPSARLAVAIVAASIAAMVGVNLLVRTGDVVDGHPTAISLTPAASPRGRPLETAQADASMQQVVGSIAIAGRVPPAGRLAPGVYVTGFGPSISFALDTADWMSSGPEADGTMGPIWTGTVGEPDGATVRFIDDPIRRIYTDPCDDTLGPPIGPGIGTFASAIADGLGLSVFGFEDVRLRSTSDTRATTLVVRVREDMGCALDAVNLWEDQGIGPRPAPPSGSAIRMWIFYPADREVFGRVVIEAETYPDVSPDLEAEIERIIDSISHGA